PAPRARDRHPSASGRYDRCRPSRPTRRSRTLVGNDEHHMALPKLYGAPAYARPAAPVAASPKPFDPDDLPLETYLSDEEREIYTELQARMYAGGVAGD